MVGLRFQRQQKGFTQFELASELGVKQNSVSQWETGRSYPSVEILIKLSQLFGCTIDELIFGKERENGKDDSLA